jgi:transcriptional regulator with XRE-family HTH domain
MSNQEIGLRLRKLRQDNKLTIANVAERVGRTAATIIKYEKGDTPIPSDLVLAFCHSFETTPNFILWGNGAEKDDDYSLAAKAKLLIDMTSKGEAEIQNRGETIWIKDKKLKQCLHYAEIGLNKEGIDRLQIEKSIRAYLDSLETLPTSQESQPKKG